MSTEPINLSELELNLLVKIAAVVHDNGLLDPEATSAAALEVAEKCSAAMAAGLFVSLSAVPPE